MHALKGIMDAVTNPLKIQYTMNIKIFPKIVNGVGGINDLPVATLIPSSTTFSTNVFIHEIAKNSQITPLQ
jgi:hypothetical protein